MEKERLVWLDFLKGSLILLVILGHAIQYCIPEGYDNNVIWNMIYSFHMPAFMAVSGFVNYKPGKFKFSIWKRRTLQLLVPFLLWSCIKWLACGNYNIDALLRITFHSGGFFWFLWTLWIIIMLTIGVHFIAYKLRIKSEILILIVALFLIASMVLFDVRIFGYQYVSYYFIFYNIGYYYSKNKSRFKITPPNLMIISLIGLWAIMAYFWRMHGVPSFLTRVHFIPHGIINYLYRFTTAIIAIYLLFIILPAICKESHWIIDKISSLGTYSLAIYGIQGCLVVEICELICGFSIAFPYFNILIAFIVTSLLSVGIYKICNKQKHASKLLFGKV